MNIHYDFDNFGVIKKPVVTTGSFDGVHLGHHVILNRINEIAGEIGGESVLITFFPHPRKVLYPNAEGKDLLMINSQREKIELLRKTGLDHLFIIRFTLEFSQTSSIDFIRKILVNKLKVACVVVGFNHYFGHNREGNFEYLYELGRFYNFEVEEIPEQDVQNETVSSTKIRNALQQGNIQRANAYLDHLYFMMGRLESGNPAISELLEYTTFKLPVEDEEKLVPPQGTYAVNIIHNNRYVRSMAIIYTYSNKLHIDLLPLEPEKLENADVNVTFHKKISEYPDFILNEHIKTHLEKDRELVDELIF